MARTELMHIDERGLALTTASAAAAEAFNAAVRDYLDYRLSAGERVKSALAADPAFVMGLCLRGYFMLLIGSNATLPAAKKALEQAKTHAESATRREAMHVTALSAWCDADTRRACDVWEQIIAEFPTDLLALRLHHFSSFWLGESRALRDLPAAASIAWNEDMPGYGNVLGMLSFGLEECGEYTEAETTGRRAVEFDPEDLWAVHAVAHVLEMQGRLKDGMAWLGQPTGTWADRNPFKDHLWWHTAMFPLEAGDYERVLALYDAEIKVDENGFYLDVQNAASLLLRLEFCGVDVGDRWQLLAEVAASRIDDHVLGFTDAHFMMALAQANRRDDAEKLLGSLRGFSASANGNTAVGVAGPLTLPICEALLAFSEKKFDLAVDLLLPLRYRWQGLGASHAQRDIFSQVLIEAAIGAGRMPLARHLLAQRTALKPNSCYTWQRYAGVLEHFGEQENAAKARKRAIPVIEVQ
ncbi:MAG: tetratricopeptide repeat protein [Rhizobiales bacterium]|nr:tetratricopeptide repeat protein [Hyphomicrobiales bacterium]